MQLDQFVRGGNQMVDAVPQGGECRVVDSASSVDAAWVGKRGWRDDVMHQRIAKQTRCLDAQRFHPKESR